jgi:hypothetical protein
MESSSQRLRTAPNIAYLAAGGQDRCGVTCGSRSTRSFPLHHCLYIPVERLSWVKRGRWHNVGVTAALHLAADQSVFVVAPQLCANFGLMHRSMKNPIRSPRRRAQGGSSAR